MVNAESNTYISSVLSQRNAWTIEEIIDVFKQLLKPFEVQNESMIQPSNDVRFLKCVVNDLPYKLYCYQNIVSNLYENNGMLSDELSINVFNADFGLDAIALIQNILNMDSDTMKTIKSVKLFHECKERLTKSILLIKTIYPELSVSAYNSNIKEIKEESMCDSMLTINIFPHTYNIENKQYNDISNLLIKSHFLFSHTIFLEYNNPNDEEQGISSFDCDYYWLDLDRSGFSKNKSRKYKINQRKKIGKHKCNFQYSIYSNLSVDDIGLYHDYEIVVPNLCPGIPSMNLFNEEQQILFYDQPFKGKDLIDTIDDYDIVAKSLGCKKVQYTLKKAIEEFPRMEISEGIGMNEKWANNVYKFYLEQALKGNTKCFNNLASLFMHTFESGFDSYIKTKQYKRAITMYTLAANDGDQNAMLNLASNFMVRKCYHEAIKYYQMASDYGMAAGSYSMGVVYQFGLYGYRKDTNAAIRYYQKSIDQYYSEDQAIPYLNTIVCKSCLNLILLMYSLDYPLKEMVKIYKKIDRPSEELKYAYTVINNNITNRAIDFFTIMKFNQIEKNDASYIKYNKIIARYDGLIYGNNRIPADKDAAIAQLKELANTKCPDWPDWEKYIWRTLAKWLQNEDDSTEVIQYWKKCIEAIPEDKCAFYTNIASTNDKKEKENKNIWKRFAVGEGCKSCHECKNYDSKKRRCPKAEYKWAINYEKNKKIAEGMILDAAKQEYHKALEKICLYDYKDKYLPNKKEDALFSLGVIPKSFKSIIKKFCKDDIYNQLCHAAHIGSDKASVMLKSIAALRDNKYENVFWNVISLNINETIKALEILIGRTIKQGYFPINTIAEFEYIRLANEKAEAITYNEKESFEFLKALAEYYIEGKDFVKAIALYEKAQEQGFDVSKRIEDIEIIIEKKNKKAPKTQYNNNYYYEDRRYSWEDSMDDAFDGCPDAYWNID